MVTLLAIWDVTRLRQAGSCVDSPIEYHSFHACQPALFRPVALACVSLFVYFTSQKTYDLNQTLTSGKKKKRRGNGKIDQHTVGLPHTHKKCECRTISRLVRDIWDYKWRHIYKKFLRCGRIQASQALTLTRKWWGRPTSVSHNRPSISREKKGGVPA